MSNRNQQNNRSDMQDDMTSKGHGTQGIDKAPGEETTQETQRGKNKVDGDPSKESDQPIEQS